jgi:Ca-activated chloride channel family protein
MLVLDASGSMQAALPGGGSKMAAAKAAVTTLLDRSPAEARLGLAVYGTGTGNAAADKKAGCQDVKVAHKVAPLDKAALGAAVTAVQPRGYTPIGQSLRVAAQELPAEGARSIVLVSDGADTCAPPDPCEVARELAKQGVDLRVHAIGFDVDETARKQLSCLTQATGGTYVDAADAATLASALNRITQRALRSYEPVGTPVTGTLEPAGAPALTPGAYLDRIGPDESRYYTVDVPAGYTLYATASTILADGSDYLVHVSRYDPEERSDCSGKATELKTEGPVGSAVLEWTAPGAGSSPPDGPCGRAGTQIVRVYLEKVFKSDQDGASALELLIGLEPPLTGDAGPAPSKDPVAFTAPAGPASAVVGGGSFSTATTLAGSGAYSDTVFTGEMVFYRVRLDWGQGLAYRLRLGGRENVGGIFVKTAWYNPARDERESDSGSYGGTEMAIPSSGALGGPPVRYRNRELTVTDPGVGARFAGWYYISVFADKRFEPLTVPVTLELTVDGRTAPRPGYGGDGKDPFGDLSGGSARSRAAAESGPGRWVLVGAGASVFSALLAAGAVGVFLLRRRRRTRTPGGGGGPGGYAPGGYVA